MTGTAARIAIVEDDLNLREHLIEIVSQVTDLDLVGVAADLRSASKLIAQSPDLFLIDIGLPDGSGLELMPDIKNGCDAKILVLTSFGDRETIVTAIESGADGYLLKDSPAEAINQGISVTLEGGAPISAAAAVYLLEHMRGKPSVSESMNDSAGLTPREIEVLTEFATGASYKETARALDMAPSTVGNHVKSIYRKLAVNSRGEAVYEAVRSGHLTL